MTKKQAIKKVENWFRKRFPGTECFIYDWHGKTIRLSEVSITKQTKEGIAGMSWMSSDPDGLAIICCAERWIMNLMLGDKDAALYEDIMGHLLKGLG